MSSALQPKNVIHANQKSLAWIQLHDESPASYGVDLWGGYSEMIPPKAALPCEKTALLENALDYIKQETFRVRYRRLILEAHVELARVEWNGMRFGKTGVAKLRATMRIGRDLVGSFRVHDVYTKSVACVFFDAGTAFRAPQVLRYCCQKRRLIPLLSY